MPDLISHATEKWTQALLRVINCTHAPLCMWILMQSQMSEEHSSVASEQTSTYLLVLEERRAVPVDDTGLRLFCQHGSRAALRVAADTLLLLFSACSLNSFIYKVADELCFMWLVYSACLQNTSTQMHLCCASTVTYVELHQLFLC